MWKKVQIRRNLLQIIVYKKGKKKKTYAEVLKSGNSFINEGIKCGKNGTVLTGNKYDAHVRKNSSKAANTFAIKFAINLCLTRTYINVLIFWTKQ